MRFLKRLSYILLLGLMLLNCDDEHTRNPFPGEVNNFVKNVNADPVMIDGIRLGDSWRLIRETASYDDDGFRKEYDYDLLKEPTYKEYWTFDKNKVLMTFKGHRYEKNFNGYYETFNTQIDPENKTVSIEYVYDDGEKVYHVDWKIASLTQTELILRVDDPITGEFEQNTFRREKF